MHRPSTARSVDPTGKLRAMAKAAGKKDIAKALKHAVHVHPEREIYREPTPDQQKFVKRIVRKVEVPYERKVKVPIKTTKLIPVTTKQRVKTKKLVEVDDFKEVDEKVAVTRERPEVREREVWVKKIVKETVMVPYTEHVMRKKRVPTKKLVEVEDYQDVEVTTNKAVTVDGFRVDTVHDSKLVEVEEEHEYVMRPQLNDHRIVTHRELGRAPKTKRGHLSRTIGRESYARDEAHMVDADSDSDPDDTEVPPPMPLKTRIGFTLRQRVGGAGTDPPVVAGLQHDGPAHRAGIRDGDLVVGVNGVNVSDIRSFRNQVGATTGPVELQVNRGGRSFNVTVKRKRR